MRKLIVLAFTWILLAPGVATASCDAQVLDAFKIKFAGQWRSVLKNQLYKTACGTESSSGSIKYKSFSMGGSTQRVRCDSAKAKDQLYESRAEIAYQYIEPTTAAKLIDACFAGQQLKFEGVPSPGGVVEFIASYRAGIGEPIANVTDFTVVPEGLECGAEKPFFRDGRGVGIAGAQKRYSCIRKLWDVAIVITLRTDRGELSVTLPSDDIEDVHFIARGPRGSLQCAFRDTEKGVKNASNWLGEYFSCADSATCTSGKTLQHAQHCKHLHGDKLRYRHGAAQFTKSVWTTTVRQESEEYACIKDNVAQTGPLPCNEGRLKLCEKSAPELARIVRCRARFDPVG